MLIAIPSKGRAGKVKSQRVIPSAMVYVPDYEADSYIKAGVRNVVAVPATVRGITATRNWILDHADSEEVVFIDDDIMRAGYIKFFAYSTKHVGMKETELLSEWQKLFDLTREMGFRVWGTSTEGSPRSCYPYKPLSFHGYITASCMGMLNDPALRFDESFPVKEDYEICLRAHQEDGGVVCARYFYWQNSHWVDNGGCKDYRTEQMEMDCIRRLQKMYPGKVRLAPNKQSDYCIQLNL